jgi:ribonuclease-3
VTLGPSGAIEMDPERRRLIERRLGFRFLDEERLEGALTHSSAKTETRPSNERLEFLGDAVIGLVVSHFLYSAFPDRDEGELTRLKSVVVSESALAAEALRLGLDQVVEVGKGIPRRQIPSSILANTFEAVAGAILLDGGLEAARTFILENLAGQLELVVGSRHARNWKSLLQQYTQRAFGVTPTYEVLSSSGPEHGKEFQVAALVEHVSRGRGRGRSKKEAEQEAARAALAALLVDSGAGDLAARVADAASDEELEERLEAEAFAARERRLSGAAPPAEGRAGS